MVSPSAQLRRDPDSYSSHSNQCCRSTCRRCSISERAGWWAFGGERSHSTSVQKASGAQVCDQPRRPPQPLWEACLCTPPGWLSQLLVDPIPLQQSENTLISCRVCACADPSFLGSLVDRLMLTGSCMTSGPTGPRSVPLSMPLLSAGRVWLAFVVCALVMHMGVFRFVQSGVCAQLVHRRQVVTGQASSLASWRCSPSEFGSTSLAASRF